MTNGAQNNVEQISHHVTLSFEMIHMSHVHSNISIIAKLGVINSQFYRFLSQRAQQNICFFKYLENVASLAMPG